MDVQRAVGATRSLQKDLRARAPHNARPWAAGESFGAQHVLPERCALGQHGADGQGVADRVRCCTRRLGVSVTLTCSQTQRLTALLRCG